MATWSVEELQNEVCPQCGKIYSVRHELLPLKGREIFACRCGYIMRPQSEAGLYIYTPVGASRSLLRR